MYSRLQSYMIEELNEVGEVGLAILIPMFCKLEKGVSLKADSLSSPESYEISEDDFRSLTAQVQEIYAKLNLGLFKYISKTQINDKKWEEHFDLLSEQEKEQVFMNKDLWLGRSDNPTFVISIKGDL